MTETLNRYKKKIGLPRLIITSLYLTLCIIAIFNDLPIGSLSSDTIKRFGMNGIMVLAMVPSIESGIGPNFGLPVGIICGLLGALFSFELLLTGAAGFWAAIAIAIPFAIIAGGLYGHMLNKIKGSEMLVATYTGFSAVFLMSIVWLVIPLNHPEMGWPIGAGLRNTISLESTYAKILNNFMSFTIGKFIFPTGLILFFFAMCAIQWVFSRSKTGVAMKASGDNPKFALASGINVDKCRLLGSVLSTVLGAVGIIVYAQSYGFIQLYEAPLMMAFPAVAAVLIGGASAKKVKISHVIIGTFLFQGLLTLALPVADSVLQGGGLAEIIRMVVQNGIILYALTKVGGE